VTNAGPVGLCIACAHYKTLALYERDANGQSPREYEAKGLCLACRDASINLRGPCGADCFCHTVRARGRVEYPS